MKTIFIALLVLSTQTAFPASIIGGMDGGGGGTLPTYPVPVYMVQDIAYEAKPKLLFLFNSYERQLKYPQRNSLVSKLFLGPRKVQDVLKDLRVEVRSDQPCLSSQGTEVDGSIFGIKPNTICISAFRISQKVDMAVADREILALLAHEVSHFMGADESEATDLQKEIAWSILNSPQGTEIDFERIRNDYSDGISLLEKTIEELEENRLDTGLSWFSRALVALTRMKADSASLIFRAFSPREEDYQDLLRLRLIWAARFLKTTIPGPDQTEHKNNYEVRFNGRDHFLLADEILFENHLYAMEKILKIDSTSELIDLLISITKEYEVRSAYLYQSTFGNDWLLIDGHLTKTFINPWENFTGSYYVQKIECTSSEDSSLNMDLLKIRIYKSGDSLILEKKTPWGYASDRIELGAFNFNTYLNDYGLIASNKVYMTHEMGGSWSNLTFLDRYVSKFSLETF